MSANRIVAIGRALATSVCLLVAGYLAGKGLDGWGWFLFVALLIH